MYAATAVLSIALLVMVSRHHAASFSVPLPNVTESSYLRFSTQKPSLVDHLSRAGTKNNATECEGPACHVGQVACTCQGFCKYVSSTNPCTCTRRWYCTLLQATFSNHNSTEVATDASGETKQSNQTRISHVQSGN